MADKSNIEWTDATWNPIVGCSIVSPGCTNCYAMSMAHRINMMTLSSHYEGTTKKVNGNVVWTGKVALANDHIFRAPLRWKRGRRIFVNSMGDLFHESIPDAWIDKAFAVMALAPQHTFQVLTKRSDRMRQYVSDWHASTIGAGDVCARIVYRCVEHRNVAFAETVTPAKIRYRWPLPNVWLGVSAERQQEADERIPDLLATPAAVRFVSLEPLIGPIDLERVAYDGITEVAALSGNHIFSDIANGTRLDWVIVGGESGPHARPMHPQWARDIRDQCAAAGVPFFFKQWGEWLPHKPVAGGDLGGDVRTGRVRIVHPTGQSDVEVSVVTGGRSTIPGSRYMARVGKKAAGRLLDGIEHSEFPVMERASI